MACLLKTTALILLIHFVSVGCTSTLYTFKSQGDSLSSTISVTEDEAVTPTVWGITLCAFVRPTHYSRERMSLITVAGEDRTLSLGFDSRGMIQVVDSFSSTSCKDETFFSSKKIESFPALEWNHFCLQASVNDITIIMDGFKVKTCSTSLKAMQNFQVYFGNDKLSAGLNFIGEVSNIKLWLKLLPKVDIQHVLKECKKLSVESREVEWEMKGEIESKSEFCPYKSYEFVVLPSRKSYDRSVSQCQKYGLELYKDDSLLNLDILIDGLKNHEDKCYSSTNIGAWINYGNFNENICKSINKKSKVEESIDCRSELCAACQFDSPRPTFYLRGLCSIKNEDLSFKPAIINKTELYFQGIHGHVIVQNERSWLLKKSLTGDIIAQMNHQEIVGTRFWNIREQFCNVSPNVEAELSFNDCSSDQSWCRDGTCIGSKDRCDNLKHCSDGSDEDFCNVVVPRKSARQTVVDDFPRTEIEVSLKTEVLHILQQEGNKPLQVVIKFWLIWTDSDSTLSNLQVNKPTGVKLSEGLWIPEIIPSGQVPDPGDCIGEQCDEPLKITALAKYNALPEDRDNANGDQLFGNVTLQLTRLSIHTMDCGGQHLSYFPFEQHLCELRFSPSSSQFRIKTLTASLPDQHTEHFMVMKAKLTPYTTDYNGQVKTKAILQVHIKRYVGFYVVAVFLPSIFLMMLNSVVLWVLQPPEYRLNISIFVTVSLILQWVIIVCNAPKSSAVRAIDVWMVFGIIHSLLHVMVHVIIQALGYEEEKDEKGSRMFSTFSSRPASRLRQVKPLEMNNLYDVLLAKMAQEENKNTWTIAYWVMFSTRVVSPTITLLFMVTFWPFVVVYTEKTL